MLACSGQLQEAVKRSSEADSALTACKEANTDLTNRQPRLDCRLQLLTKEVDSLKQVLKMYEDEAPTTSTSQGHLKLDS